MATATLAPQTVRLHHPRCPNVDSGVPAVAEWTAEQLDDLLASTALFAGCGFCRRLFPADAPDYSPPPAVLTRKPSPRPRPPAPQEGSADE